MSNDDDIPDKTTGHDRTDDDHPDLDAWYDDVRVVGFKEQYSIRGELMVVEVTLRAEYFEAGSEGPIPAGEDQFVLKAKSTDRTKHLQVTRFRPTRTEEAKGLTYEEFPLFWEAVGELDLRGFTVDTGALEYGGSHLDRGAD